jgi:hypothetical protein
MGCKKKTRSVISEFMGPEFYSVYRAYYYIKKKTKERKNRAASPPHALCPVSPPTPALLMRLSPLSLHALLLSASLLATSSIARTTSHGQVRNE